MYTLREAKRVDGGGGGGGDAWKPLARDLGIHATRNPERSVEPARARASASADAIRSGRRGMMRSTGYAHTGQRDACEHTLVYCVNYDLLSGHRQSIMCLTNTTTMSDTNYARYCEMINRSRFVTSLSRMRACTVYAYAGSGGLWLCECLIYTIR